MASRQHDAQKIDLLIYLTFAETSYHRRYSAKMLEMDKETKRALSVILKWCPYAEK